MRIENALLELLIQKITFASNLIAFQQKIPPNWNLINLYRQTWMKEDLEIGKSKIVLRYIFMQNFRNIKKKSVMCSGHKPILCLAEITAIIWLQNHTVNSPPQENKVRNIRNLFAIIFLLQWKGISLIKFGDADSLN